MRDRSQIKMSEVAATMEETEIMWTSVCGQVDDVRVDMLIEAMIEQYALVMEGETNANALMSLVGFIANQAIQLHKQGDMSIESSMVLLQIGMQRGIQAHFAVEDKRGST